jgi:hypothetical protein
MASFTVRVGLILVVLGVASYGMTGATSPTALIPSVVGSVLALCGVLANRSRAPRPVALRVAVVVAALGLVGTAGALSQLGAVLAGAGAPVRPSLVARASMALVLLVYLVFAVRSFILGALRRGRT